MSFLDRFTRAGSKPPGSAELQTRLTAARSTLATKETKLAERREALSFVDPAGPGAAAKRARVVELQTEVDAWRKHVDAIEHAHQEALEEEAAARLSAAWETARAGVPAVMEIAQNLADLLAQVVVVGTALQEAERKFVESLPKPLPADFVAGALSRDLGRLITTNLFGTSEGKIAGGIETHLSPWELRESGRTDIVKVVAEYVAFAMKDEPAVAQAPAQPATLEVENATDRSLQQ